MQHYSLIDIDKITITQGLNNLLGREFSINASSYSKSDIEIVINHILDYINIYNQTIKDKETFGCGSWMIQFVFNDTYIELHELKEIKEGNNIYVFDLSNTIYFLKDQLELCSKQEATPIIPRLGQKIAVSKEIFEGSEINAVRYEAPDHMSGWYLTSNSYNGDVNTLSVDYLYYLLKSRPEIAKFLALPYGYRFFKDASGEEVWYDKEVIQ